MSSAGASCRSLASKTLPSRGRARGVSGRREGGAGPQRSAHPPDTPSPRRAAAGAEHLLTRFFKRKSPLHSDRRKKYPEKGVQWSWTVNNNASPALTFGRGDFRERSIPLETVSSRFTPGSGRAKPTRSVRYRDSPSISLCSPLPKSCVNWGLLCVPSPRHASLRHAGLGCAHAVYADLFP